MIQKAEWHLRRVLKQQALDTRTRYQNGQREKNDLLENRKGVWNDLQEELIDANVYSYTLKEQVDALTVDMDNRTVTMAEASQRLKDIFS